VEPDRLLRVAHRAGWLGGFLVTVAGVVAAIGALQTNGKHTWFVVAISLFGLGILVGMVGFVGTLVVRPVVLSEVHAEALRRSAAISISGLEAGLSSEYAGNYKPREAFHAHFPTVGRGLDLWDELIGARDRHSTELRSRIEYEASGVAMRVTFPDLNIGGNCERITAVIKNSTLARAERGELDERFSLVDHPLDTLQLLKGDDETADEWVARQNRAIDRVEKFGQESQRWSEAEETAVAYLNLRCFENDVLAELLDELRIVQEQALTYTRRCPACRRAAS